MTLDWIYLIFQLFYNSLFVPLNRLWFTIHLQSLFICNISSNFIGCFTVIAYFTDPPEIIKKPVNQGVRVGGVATFFCAARGDPQPTVIWRKNSKKIMSKYMHLFLSYVFNKLHVAVADTTLNIVNAPVTHAFLLHESLIIIRQA